MDADRALRPRLVEDEAGDARVVVDRLGVGHRADGGEAARGGGPGAGGDRLPVLPARLPEMGVEVDESRADDEAPRLDHVGPAGGELCADLRHPAVLEDDVLRAVDPARRVDDAAALQQHLHPSAPPPRRRRSTAMRTATPLVT